MQTIDGNSDNNISNNDPYPLFPESLFSIGDVQKRLNLSRSSVYKLIETGELASVKIGRSRRVTPAALRHFIDRLHQDSPEGDDSQEDAA